MKNKILAVLLFIQPFIFIGLVVKFGLEGMLFYVIGGSGFMLCVACIGGAVELWREK